MKRVNCLPKLLARACAALLAVWLAAPPLHAQGKGDRAFGEYLANECVTCHQISGRYDGIPPIIGWPDEAFIEIMNEYKKKERANNVMQTIAGRLADDEIAALAAYFGGLPQQPAVK